MRDWIEITGWTLLHFAWQGALLGLTIAGVVWLCRRRSANARYAVASGGLLTLLAAPVVTAAVLWQAARTVEPLRPADRAAAREPGTRSPGGHALVARDSLGAVHARLAAALPGIVAVWLAGVSLLLVRMGGGLWRVHRLHEAGLAAPASRWQATAARLAARLGLVDAVRVVESRLVGTPTVVGWMRPIVLLPVAALANLTPAQVEAILAHELAHVRRHDYLVNLLQSFGETVLFFHPAVWWVSGRIRAEREHCCDDVALLVSGDRVGYASALAALEEWRGGEAAPALGAADGPLGGRVRRILGRPSDARPRFGRRFAAWAAALALCAGAGAAVWPHGSASGVAPAAGTGSAQGAQAAGPAAAADWRESETEHFEIRYGAALADDIDRVEVAAERAHRRVGERLADELSFKVPLIVFGTREGFERQDVAPGANLTGISSFSEPTANRIVVLVEEWGDGLVDRIAHELTHVFAFEAVPRADPGVGVPLWVDEGLADYGVGTWSTADEGILRGLVESGDIPAMSTVEGRAGFENPRAVYALGHAVFDFVEAAWGRAAVSAFLRAFSPAGNPYQEVLGLAPAAFDAAFADHLRARFAPDAQAPRP
ncbi:MAG: M56 family metallopeptidase [Acidobacteria bacterium]|nr:M56 family metallopeptidase [Acidobacteriota bacterium]